MKFLIYMFRSFFNTLPSNLSPPTMIVKAVIFRFRSWN